MITHEIFIQLGSDQRKKWFIFWRDPDHSLHIKILNFQRYSFQCIFNDFGFLADITPKEMSGSLCNFSCWSSLVK